MQLVVKVRFSNRPCFAGVFQISASKSFGIFPKPGLGLSAEKRRLMALYK
jgi:hypothetical protein